MQETVQDAVQTVQDRVQDTLESVQDTIESTADRLRPDRPSPGRRFPWRPLLVTVGIAAVALGAAQALRIARGRRADMQPIETEEAAAQVVARSADAVTDISERARASVGDVF